MEPKELSDYIEARGIDRKDYEDAVQARYRKLFEHNEEFANGGRAVTAIRSLKELTDIGPAEELVQAEYEKLVRSRNIHPYGGDLRKSNIQYLFDFSGIEPSEDLIRDTVLNGGISILQEATGVAVPENIAQEGYRHFLHTKNFRRIGSLKAITKVEPAFSEDEIQRVYDALWDDEDQGGICCTGSLWKMQELQEVTDIAPRFSSDSVQEKYRTYIAQGALERLSQLERVTGVKPEILSSVVQEAYANYVKEPWKFHLLEKLKEITSVEPELSSDAILSGYLASANRWSSYLAPFTALENFD